MGLISLPHSWELYHCLSFLLPLRPTEISLSAILRDYQLLTIEFEAQSHQICPSDTVMMGKDQLL